jgi:phosphohistidine phosphatase
MDLILWRHAEAESADDEGEDLERHLTPRGERQASRMAKWLDRQLPEGVKIYCSPAQRCLQTVQTLGRKFKVRDELSPQCDHQDLLTLAQWPHAKMTILIVGHQPALGLTIAQTLGISALQWSVRKGSIWWLRSKQREEGLLTQLVTVQSPDLM